MTQIALTPSLAAKLCVLRGSSYLFQKDADCPEQRFAGAKTGKLVVNLLLAVMCSQFIQAQEKLVVESPVNGQKFTSGHVVAVVKVDPSVKRVMAAVTVPTDQQPAPKKPKNSNIGDAATEDRAAPATRTVFTLGPVALPRGADRWSPDISLAKGENTITIRDAENSETSAVVKVTADESDSPSDNRTDFQGSFYAGASIDSFASNETKQYIGYTAADSGPKTGYTAGVDFEYRLFKRNTESRWPVQLWVFGETVHGQRSTEVDCSQAKSNATVASPVCSGFNPDNAPDAFLAVLRNSSSLEAYAGARLEFLKLNRSSNHSANLFVKSQFGFVTVQNNGGDLADDHLRLALGTILTNGPFRGSYMDVGWGRTDLFAVHRGRRFKVDGYIEWEANVSDRVRFSPYFQIVVDSDFGRGSDDVRSYYGIKMEIQALSCLFNPAGCAKKKADETSAATSAKKTGRNQQ